VATTLKISAYAVEEVEQPRPHYLVNLHGSVTAMQGLPDPTAGLLPDEVVMTVRLSTEIGSDLKVIKEAAEKRALLLLETLIGHSSLASPSSTQSMAAGEGLSTAVL
jgi:hypothetical protein